MAEVPLGHTISVSATSATLAKPATGSASVMTRALAETVATTARTVTSAARVVLVAVVGDGGPER